MILGRPSGVVCSPAAPGSTPVSKMATTTPRPSYSGCACCVMALPSLLVTLMRALMPPLCMMPSCVLLQESVLKLDPDSVLYLEKLQGADLSFWHCAAKACGAASRRCRGF
jgi:hypothetical protein